MKLGFKGTGLRLGSPSCHGLGLNHGLGLKLGVPILPWFSVARPRRILLDWDERQKNRKRKRGGPLGGRKIVIQEMKTCMITKRKNRARKRGVKENIKKKKDRDPGDEDEGGRVADENCMCAFVCVCARVYVCVCVRERERERGGC